MCGKNESICLTISNSLGVDCVLVCDFGLHGMYMNDKQLKMTIDDIMFECQNCSVLLVQLQSHAHDH